MRRLTRTQSTDGFGLVLAFELPLSLSAHLRTLRSLEAAFPLPSGAAVEVRRA